MNFLAKAASTVGNAVEINNLKAKREKLTKEKLELEDFCARYDDQVNLIQSIQAVLESNNNSLTVLRAKFVKANVKYDVPFHEFQSSNETNPELLNCKTIYDRLMEVNKAIEQPLLELNQTVSVPREVYVDKIATLGTEIEKVNEKLKVVREKQHGKKN